jgi:hypothetical protein
MVRVTRLDGEVILFDFDYRGTIIDTSMTELARKVNLLLERSIPSPHAGGSMFRTLRNVGLKNIRVEPQMFPVPILFIRRWLMGV